MVEFPILIDYDYLKAYDERRRASENAAKAQEEVSAVRSELARELEEVRRQHDEQVANLEQRLETALGESNIVCHFNTFLMTV